MSRNTILASAIQATQSNKGPNACPVPPIEPRALLVDCFNTALRELNRAYVELCTLQNDIIQENSGQLEIPIGIGSIRALTTNGIDQMHDLAANIIRVTSEIRDTLRT